MHKSKVREEKLMTLESSVAHVPDVQLCLETPLSAAYLEYITRLPSYVGQIVAHVL